MVRFSPKRFVHSCDNLCSLSVQPEPFAKAQDRLRGAKSKAATSAGNVLFDSAAYAATLRANGGAFVPAVQFCSNVVWFDLGVTVLRARLLTAAVALPPLIFLVCCAPLWLFTVVLLGCTGLGLLEYFSLARVHNPLPPAAGLTWGMAVAVSMLSPHLVAVGATLTAGLFLVFLLALRDPQPARALVGISDSLLGVIYVGFLLPHLIWIRRGPDGVAWVFFVLLVAMLGDTGGYAIGRIWGKHKLIPHISPGKTIEGSGGSVLGNLCAAWLSWVWLLPQRSLLEILLLGLSAGFLAQVGDLCESALKRAFGAKDSGHLLPGHGGILDRVDSLLFPAAFIYYYVTIWG